MVCSKHAEVFSPQKIVISEANKNFSSKDPLSCEKKQSSEQIVSVVLCSSNLRKKIEAYIVTEVSLC